ncbi:hypothetical protein CUMW_207740 [Citrus unshiu]|uniref:SHSP domain-containing protein n=1 Tax=Citrus unshiu TaxID=55188 RepID=A0A2H5Q957_CITUN|nr:hypothetical protein CUMW_207740 [Citrus unshiu]
MDPLAFIIESTKFIDSSNISTRWEYDGDKIVCKASLPAAKMEDVKIDIDDKVLTITRELTSADRGTILRPVLKVSKNFDLPDGVKRSNFKSTSMEDGVLTVTFTRDAAAPGIVESDQHQLIRDYEWEIENRKIIRFLKAKMFTEFHGGHNKVMVVRVVSLPAGIEKKDVAIAVENGNLVMKLSTMLEDYGKIEKRAELPDGATVSKISTLMEDQTLIVTVALEKAEPEEKPKSMISKIKGALAKAWPGCLVVGAKTGFDAITDGDAN